MALTRQKTSKPCGRIVGSRIVGSSSWRGTVWPLERAVHSSNRRISTLEAMKMTSPSTVESFTLLQRQPEKSDRQLLDATSVEGLEHQMIRVVVETYQTVKISNQVWWGCACAHFSFIKNYSFYFILFWYVVFQFWFIFSFENIFTLTLLLYLYYRTTESTSP